MTIKSNENEDATGQQGKKKKEKKQETKQRQREVSRAAGGWGSRVEDSRANRSDQRHFVSFKCFFLHCFRHLPFTLYVSLTHTHTHTLAPHTHTHTHTRLGCRVLAVILLISSFRPALQTLLFSHVYNLFGLL